MSRVGHEWEITLNPGLALWRCALCRDTERMTAISMQDPERIASLLVSLQRPCRMRGPQLAPAPTPPLRCACGAIDLHGPVIDKNNAHHTPDGCASPTWAKPR